MDWLREKIIICVHPHTQIKNVVLKSIKTNLEKYIYIYFI